MSKSFDLITIGAGSGGIAATIRAAKHGAKCAVIEASDLGGTCVNLGCVPKKVMWNASHIADVIAYSKSYGFSFDTQDFSWETLVTKREHYIERLRKAYSKRLQENNITQIRGFAKFIDENTIMVDNKIYSAKHIIIASGSQAKIPNITGADFGVTSDGFFALKEMPKKIAIVGAGYIAVELAGILNKLGADVHLAFRHNTPLRHYDAMLPDVLMEIMQQQRLHLLPNHSPQSVQRNANGTYQLNFQDDKVLSEMDCIIWAIGRAANSQNLDLANAGVELDNKGNIIVDDKQNTSVKGIYAVGDVTGKIPLTPVAIAAGRRLSDRLFAGNSEAKLDYNNIPTVVFSHPPIATIGLSTEQAIETYGEDNLKIYETRFTSMINAICDTRVPTAIKIITQGEAQTVIGCHMIGDHADEILQGFAVAIKMGCTYQDLQNTVAIHPTSAEEIVTIV